MPLAHLGPGTQAYLVQSTETRVLGSISISTVLQELGSSTRRGAFYFAKIEANLGITQAS